VPKGVYERAGGSSVLYNEVLGAFGKFEGVFDDDQWKAYQKLNAQQKLYVEYRGRAGLTYENAGRNAGYTGNNVRQACYLMEKNKPILKELIDAMQRSIVAQNVAALSEKPKGEVAKLEDKNVNALVEKKAQDLVGTGEVEAAKRILLLQKICSGKIKYVEKVKKYDGDKKLLGFQTREIKDPRVMMEARKQLDAALGLGRILDLGSREIGGVTVQFIDARQGSEPKPEVVDVAYQNLADKVQVIDGEEVVVHEMDDMGMAHKKTPKPKASNLGKVINE